MFGRVPSPCVHDDPQTQQASTHAIAATLHPGLWRDRRPHWSQMLRDLRRGGPAQTGIVWALSHGPLQIGAKTIRNWAPCKGRAPVLPAQASILDRSTCVGPPYIQVAQVLVVLLIGPSIKQAPALFSIVRGRDRAGIGPTICLVLRRGLYPHPVAFGEDPLPVKTPTGDWPKQPLQSIIYVLMLSSNRERIVTTTIKPPRP